MKVEIWSDVVCPFCYIGKKRFEQAVEDFPHPDQLEVEWKSFQLDPTVENNGDQNLTEHLAKSKGISIENARQMQQRVVSMAEEEGLQFNFDKAVVANSFDAHRLIKFARDRGKGNEMAEALFRAYFTDGKNIGDMKSLVDLAEELGLDPTEAENVLQSQKYANNVKHDIQVASGMDIRGVPFFLFDRKYAISGARETEIFLKALKQSWNESLQEQSEEQSEPSNE